MINVGIVGAGLIGAKRAESLTEETKLLGVYDISSVKSIEFSTRFSCPVFSSGVDLIEKLDEGDLLICSTPPNSSYETAKLALSMKINVLVEKPGALSAAQMKVLVDIAEQNDCIFRVGYNHRFHPGIQELRKLVSGGQFGEVQLIRARYGHGGRIGYEKEWRSDPSLSGGGELMDQGSHLLDLTRMLIGEFEINFASLPTLYWEMNVEDNAFLAGRSIDRNASIWLHASWTEWKNIFSFEVFCKSAKFEVFGLGGSYGPETLIKSVMPETLGPPKITSIQYPPGDSSWNKEMHDIILEILGGTPQGATGHDGLAVLELIEGNQ